MRSTLFEKEFFLRKIIHRARCQGQIVNLYVIMIIEHKAKSLLKGQARRNRQ